MSPKMTLLKRLYPLWFMLALTVLFMSAVTGAHLATKETVERNQSLYIKRAVLDAAGLAVPETGTEVEALFREKVKPVGADDAAAEFDAAADGGPVRVLRKSGAGLWGEIAAMVGVKPDGALSGIAFIAQNETPGLGARIEEAWFRDQFRGKKPPLALVAEGTRSAKPSDMDAITGASITSKAVRDIVNGAVRTESGSDTPGKEAGHAE